MPEMSSTVTVANLGWKLTSIFRRLFLNCFAKDDLVETKCLHFTCLSSLFDYLLSVVWIWLSVLTTRSIGIWKLLPLVHWAVIRNSLKVMTNTMNDVKYHIVLNPLGPKQSFLSLILLIQIQLTYFEFYFPLI